MTMVKPLKGKDPEIKNRLEKKFGGITSAVEALGYKIVWRGITTEKAEAVKPLKTTD
jgi:hypothetical protein